MPNTWRNTAIILAVILVIGIGIVIGYSIWGEQSQTQNIVSTPTPTTPTPTPAPTPTPEYTPSPPSNYPIADSFILEKLDEDALDEKYSDPPFSSSTSFNAYGVYVGKLFFLKAGETLEFYVRSDCPVSVDGCEDEFEGGLTAAINLTEGHNSTSFSDDWIRACDLQRTGNTYETRVTFSPDESGYYVFYVVNESGNQAFCEYIISMQ